MSETNPETEIKNQEEEAKKLKALAKLYSYLGEIEKAFEGLQKESGKLMLAENANDNFEAYYKFISPISRELNNIKNLAQLSRIELRKYQGVSCYDIFFDSSGNEKKGGKQKKEDQTTEENSQPTTPFDQLDKRIDQLEFNFRLILLFVIALFVMSTISLI